MWWKLVTGGGIVGETSTIIMLAEAFIDAEEECYRRRWKLCGKVVLMRIVQYGIECWKRSNMELNAGNCSVWNQTLKFVQHETKH